MMYCKTPVSSERITYGHTHLVAESRFERREHDPHEMD